MTCAGHGCKQQASLTTAAARELGRSLAGGWIAYNMNETIRMKYKIVLQKSEEGYSASCPGLPGCWSQGETEEEAIANIQVAIQEYLAAIEESIDQADVREIEVSI